MDIDDFDRAGLFSEVRAHGASEEVDGALLRHRDAGDWKAFFRLAVEARKNILISGPRGRARPAFPRGSSS
jgi:type IV secretion system protein VirB11